MSAMCGIVDFERKRVDFSTLREMGRAMVLRGQDQSGAYLNGGVGLYHNRALGGEEEGARQPHTVVREGRTYTVMLDGILRDSRDRLGRFSLLDFSSAAEAVLEAYLSFGLDFASYVQGSFAFAICDEYRGEVILGRSADGKCPLYYSYVEGVLCFASEIKGMLRATGGVLTVDGMALRRHLLLPAGSVSSAELFPEIYEILAGYATVFSRIDAQRVLLPFDGLAVEEMVGVEIEPWSADVPTTEACLEEALFAFDHPQFDADMPAYLGALRQAREKNARTVRISDGARRGNLFYARMREDRLGGLYGLWVDGVTPPDGKRPMREWRALEGALLVRLSKQDAALLERLYGRGAIEVAKREKDIAARIRMLGMLCQTEPWVARYGVRLLCVTA